MLWARLASYLSLGALRPAVIDHFVPVEGSEIELDQGYFVFAVAATRHIFKTTRSPAAIDATRATKLGDGSVWQRNDRVDLQRQADSQTH